LPILKVLSKDPTLVDTQGVSVVKHDQRAIGNRAAINE